MCLNILANVAVECGCVQGGKFMHVCLGVVYIIVGEEHRNFSFFFLSQFSVIPLCRSTG